MGGGEGFRPGLKGGVERRAHRRPGVRREQSVGQVHGVKGQGPASAGDSVARGQRSFVLGESAELHRPPQYLVPGGARTLRVPVRAQARRSLRQHDQKSRLRIRQVRRLLAQPGERGGADPFQVSAVGRQGQVELEDLPLREMGFELEGAQHLQTLGPQGPRPRFQQARDLHGQGGRTRDHGARHRPLGERAHHRQRVDPRVIVEPAVLVRDEQPDEPRVHVGQAGLQADLVVAGDGDPQSGAVLRDQDAGQVPGLGRGQGEGRVERQARDGEHGGRRQTQECDAPA